MRLYLSSQNVGNHVHRLVDMVGKNRTVAYISNAKDYSSLERRLKIPVHRTEFESLGFKFKEYDLRKYIGKSTELEAEITKFGLVFATGGNTFLLRRAMHDSGLDKIIIEGLKKDKFVYGGSSAGSIVACPSLKGVETGDDPEAVEKIYHKEVIWEGLNLVNFYLSVHHGSAWFGREAEAMVDFFKLHNMPYKTLSDGQVLVVDNDKQEILV